MDFCWEDFVSSFVRHNIQIELIYCDKIFVFRHDKKRSSFSIEQQGNIIVKEEYRTPEELLEKVIVDEKNLKSIASELKYDSV